MQINDDWAKPGLYVISFANGAQYVGMSSVSVRARLLHHICKAGLGSNLALHCAMRKHGLDSLSAEAVFLYPDADLCEAEIAMIAERRAAGVRLYNLTSGGEGRRGYSLTEQARGKIGAANRDPVRVRARAEALRRPEVKARMVDGQRRSWTPERKARFADTKRGEAAPCAKLRAEDVRSIKQRLAAMESCASISRSFGVTPEAISRIKCGKSWAHVD
jgi:hypothetical protein